MSDQQPDDEPIVMVPWVPPKNHTWKYILRAVTIFQLLQAEPSPFFEDKSLVLEGRGFAAVTLVAHVTRVEIMAAKAQYILEDGTGIIYADKELDSLSRGGGLSVEVEEEETARYRASEHTYVEVLGVPRRPDNSRWTRLSIKCIHPVHDYHQVMHHTLNVIHSNMLVQQHVQPYDVDTDFGSNEVMEVHVPVDESDGQAYQGDISVQPDPEDRSNDAMEVYIPVDDGQASGYQDDISIRLDSEDLITYAIPASPPVFPNTFSPQRHRPYAALEPLERAIMKYMCHHRNHPVLIAELAQVIQASCGCTELQFNVAVQALLSEAYITSPLDDGYVVITPRH